MKVKRFISAIPYWAYALVLLVALVNTTYLIFRYQISAGGGDEGIFENGQYIITEIKPGSPVDKAGIEVGDILISINSVPYTEDYDLNHKHKAGETISFLILRKHEEFAIPVLLVSILTEVSGFFQVMYGLILILSISSLYILYKKPGDPAVKIFFIYLQLFAMMQNAGTLKFRDPFASIAVIAFLFSGCLSVAILINFHLLFPRRLSIYTRNKRLPFIFYGIGFLVAVFYSISYILYIYYPSPKNVSAYFLFDRYGVTWMTLAFSIALTIAIYQFITNKNTLARNQLRIVILGSLFGFITPMTLAIFYNFDFIIQLASEFPFFIIFSQAVGSIIMIVCLLIAIFRYRIWGTEIFIRKALLYLVATMIIILSYLFLVFLVDNLTISETKVTRFVILAISVTTFLVLKDSIQRLIDRFFHRESYDSATVVSDFEEKLAGIYQFDELKNRIVQGIDEIFHFKSFVFNLKKSELIYEPAFIMGVDNQKMHMEFEISHELDRMLRKSKIFSPEELDKKPSVIEISSGELIVPLLSGDQPFGFFLCGQKKSERVYSMQDIQVLSLLARRIIALFHTATLYQKDLDRQLMLERERARISQDMHDDIGAGLTKIAMISEARLTNPDQVPEVTDRMSRLSSTARDMIARLNVIVWALNPKYDNLDSLVSYIRRYFGEYLDNFRINFKMEAPEVISDLPITPDFRRNTFYAIQEAIHNAVKHGSCSAIGLGLNINNNNMFITITDNGKGFEQGRTGSNGNGLINMKKRAEELGGSLDIHSSPGNGTRISFKISLPENTTKG